MKKFLTITLLFVMVLMAFTTVKAVSASELAEQLYNIGANYGMTQADKVKIERYFTENPATEAEAQSIVAKANETVNVMNNAGTTKYNELTAAQKDEVKAKANEAASVVGVQLVFKTSSVQVVKNGKVVETITNNDGKLAYTGNNANIALVVVSAIAIVALAIAAVAKKRLINE